MTALIRRFPNSRPTPPKRPMAVPRTTIAANSLKVKRSPFQRRCRLSQTTFMPSLLSSIIGFPLRRSDRPPDATLRKPQGERQEKGSDQVKQACRRPAFDRAEVFGIDMIRGETKFTNADEIGDPGVLEKGNERIAQRRQDGPKHDRCRHVARQCESTQPDCPTGVEVSPADREDTGAEDFGEIGAGVN